MEVIENNLRIIIYRFKSYTAKNANIFILIVLAGGKKKFFRTSRLSSTLLFISSLIIRVLKPGFPRFIYLNRRNNREYIGWNINFNIYSRRY